jgi:hypothetical protein
MSVGSPEPGLAMVKLTVFVVLVIVVILLSRYIVVQTGVWHLSQALESAGTSS